MKRNKKFRAPRFTTVIGRDASIRGDLTFSGGLHLDGRVEGHVLSQDDDARATLTVSELGQIEGDVRVANLILNGTVRGDVYATERVELAEKARVTGKVHYRMLEMALGAEVNGELVRLDEEMAPSPRLLTGKVAADEGES